jgi:hypothetical protein
MISVEQDAKQLLTDLFLYKFPVDPIEICRKLNIMYDEQPYEGFDGAILIIGDRQLIGVSSRIKDSGRKSFTCAHELGHAHYDIGTFQCTRDDVGYGKSKTDVKELRANEFASELLLPKDLFLGQIGKQEPSWKLLQKLSKTFQTSLQATTNRFVKLTHHTCWLVVVKNKIIQRFTKADHNDFSLHIRQSFKPPRTNPGGFKDTLADSWIYGSRKTNYKKLLYWPLPENQYGESPVLLWDRDNVLLNDEYLQDEFDDELARREDDTYRYR